MATTTVGSSLALTTVPMIFCSSGNSAQKRTACSPSSLRGRTLTSVRPSLTTPSDDSSLENHKTLVSFSLEYVVTEHDLEKYKKTAFGLKQIHLKDAFDKFIKKVKDIAEQAEAVKTAAAHAANPAKGAGSDAAHPPNANMED